MRKALCVPRERGTPEDTVDRLCRSEEPRLLRFVMTIVHEPDLAREVVQESYVQLRTREGSGGLRFPRRYLYGIANNCALKILRRRRLEARVIQGPAGMEEIADDEAARPDRQVMSEQILQRVYEVIASLDEDERTIVILGFVDKQPRAEIARRMGLSLKAVDLRTTRTMVKFRRRLRAHGIDLSNLEK